MTSKRRSNKINFLSLSFVSKCNFSYLTKLQKYGIFTNLWLLMFLDGIVKFLEAICKHNCAALRLRIFKTQNIKNIVIYLLYFQLYASKLSFKSSLLTLLRIFDFLTFFFFVLMPLNNVFDNFLSVQTSALVAAL